MWACNICGALHEKLYDACHNCACRQNPAAVAYYRGRVFRRLGQGAAFFRARANRCFGSFVVRVVLGLAIGVALGAIEFPEAPPTSVALSTGAEIGLYIGVIWGLGAILQVLFAKTEASATDAQLACNAGAFPTFPDQVSEGFMVEGSAIQPTRPPSME
jgi:hypothetical protein